MTDSLSRASAFTACIGKEAFSSPQLAAKIAKRRSASMKRRSKTPIKPFNAYKCHVCHWFHIGTVVKPISRPSRHPDPEGAVEP